jgi:arabinogalactan oligomer/maltooligosaccharide transport system substrate-binding protein
MTRTTRTLAIAAGLALALAGCGGDDGNGDDSSADETPSTEAGADEEPSERETDEAAAFSGALTVWADDTRSQIVVEIGEQFTAETGVSVDVVEKDFADIRDDLTTMGPTGEGPDVIVGAHDWVGKLVQNGGLSPVELGDKAAMFQPVTLDAFSYDGQLYGAPYATENVALARNTALAPDQPESWDDMIAHGQQLVADGDADLPIGLQFSPPDGDPYHMFPVQTSFGSTVFGSDDAGSYDPANLVLDDEAGIAFAEALAQLGADDVLSTSVTFDIAKEAFMEGKTPYIITGPWNIADFEDAGVEFVIEEIPSAGGETSRPFVGVQGFMISSFSENQLAANEFVVNYLTTEDVALQIYEANDRPPAMTSVFEQVSDDPVIEGFGRVGAEGQPMPSIPEMDAVWAEWGAAEIAIVDGTADPEALWTQMSERIRQQISE